jgi:hypothetical protein
MASQAGLLSPTKSFTSTSCSKLMSEPTVHCKEGSGHDNVSCSRSHVGIQMFDQLPGRINEPW